MALKTLVKVGKITNLSDARYCSGMHVDMLGFVVVAGQENYVDPEFFKEIRGWFSGPAIVAEAYGIQKKEDLTAIQQQYVPDLIELSIQELRKIQSLSSPIILSTTCEELRTIEPALASYRDQISYVLIPAATKKKEIEDLAARYPVILQVDSEIQVEAVLNSIAVKGIALHGSPEEKPGLKNYDSLSLILEKLEVDDL